MRIDFENAVWALNQLAVLLVLYRIFSVRLLPQYKFFTLYLSLSLVATILLALYRFSPYRDLNRYADISISWGYLAPIFVALTISEFVNAALGPFPALELLFKRILRVLWVALAIFGCFWYQYLLLNSNVPFPTLKAAITYQQTASTAFALFLLSFLLFVAFVPVPMLPSRLLHGILLGFFFTTMAVGRLLALLNDYNWSRKYGSILSMFGCGIILFLWAWKLRTDRDSDRLRIATRPLDAMEVDTYMRRLEHMNATVAESGPRFLR